MGAGIAGLIGRRLPPTARAVAHQTSPAYLRVMTSATSLARCCRSAACAARLSSAAAAVSLSHSSPSLAFRPMRLRVADPLSGASRSASATPVPSPARNSGSVELLLPFDSNRSIWVIDLLPHSYATRRPHAALWSWDRATSRQHAARLLPARAPMHESIRPSDRKLVTESGRMAAWGQSLVVKSARNRQTPPLTHRYCRCAARAYGVWQPSCSYSASLYPRGQQITGRKPESS